MLVAVVECAVGHRGAEAATVQTTPFLKLYLDAKCKTKLIKYGK